MKFLKNSILVEYIPALLILLVLLVILYFLSSTTPKESASTESLVRSTFKCPEEIQDPEDYLRNRAEIFSILQEENPDITSEEVTQIIIDLSKEKGCTNDAEYLNNLDSQKLEDDLEESVSEYNVNKTNSKYQSVLSIHTGDEVSWSGKIHERLTHGRLVVESTDTEAKFKYFIIDPPDYTEDGAYKHSPTTREINMEDIVQYTGIVSDPCWWELNLAEDPGPEECIPWINVSSVKYINKETVSEEEIYNDPYVLHIRTAIDNYLNGSNVGLETEAINPTA